MDAHTDSRLVLEMADCSIELPPVEAHQSGQQGVVFRIGRDTNNDLVCGTEVASRHHARIERLRKDFYLIDCSTNGTYVQMEDEQVTHVHRDKVKLWGQGWISLGQPLNMGQPIHFRQG